MPKTSASRDDRTTVLVADDQRAVREALASVVSSEPALRLVGVASEAEEAIRLAKEHRPDVALLDIKMPKGGGLRATREIRAASQSTQVVIHTAYQDRANLFQLLEAGAIGYLIKGSSATEIREALVRAGHGYGSLSPSVTSDVVSEFAAQLNERAALEDVVRERTERIRRALKPGAIRTVFQPIVELASRRTIGFEALSRFGVEPRRPPDEWFHEAEQVGLGVELELAALRVATSQLPAVPADAFLSLNVSPSVLASPELASLLATLPCERLVLELTEHASIDDYDTMRVALEPLRRLGCRIAVDDAGAGFASLGHILELSPEVFKIDRSLIAQIRASAAARAVIAGFAAFAAEMSLVAIAEGIEDDAVVGILVAQGLHIGQGYYIGLPGPLAAG